MYLGRHAHTHICIYIYMFMYTLTHVCKHTYTYVYVCVYMCVVYVPSHNYLQIRICTRRCMLHTYKHRYQILYLDINVDTSSTYLHLHTDFASKVLTGGRAANYQASLRASLQQERVLKYAWVSACFFSCRSAPHLSV